MWVHFPFSFEETCNAEDFWGFGDGRGGRRMPQFVAAQDGKGPERPNPRGDCSTAST